MTETSGRLLQLLSLLQARRDWPGAELADRLEVSGRTIRRDVERLRALGYPVQSLTGPAGGYRLQAGTAMPPLLLDEDEAIAIAVGLRTAARARQPRAALVPGRLGPAPRGLADVPRRPDRARGGDRRALRGPHAARRGPRGVRRAEPRRRVQPLRGPRHRPRRGRGPHAPA